MNNTAILSSVICTEYDSENKLSFAETHFGCIMDQNPEPSTPPGTEASPVIIAWFLKRTWGRVSDWVITKDKIDGFQYTLPIAGEPLANLTKKHLEVTLREIANIRSCLLSGIKQEIYPRHKNESIWHVGELFLRMENEIAATLAKIKE